MKRLDSIGDEFYIYDGTDIVLDFVDFGSGVELAQRYLWGPAEDQLLAQEDYDAGLDETVQVLWAAADHQGSVRDYLVYDAGLDETTLYTHFNLDSFSNIVSGDTEGVRYIYTGQEFDAESGVYYYDARYYDAAIGRFISEDPIGFAGDPSNSFRYVGNAPTMYTDPTGEFLHIIIGAAFGAVAGAINGALHDSDPNSAWGSWDGALTGALSGAVGGAVGAATFGGVVAIAGGGFVVGAGAGAAAGAASGVAGGLVQEIGDAIHGDGFSGQDLRDSVIKNTCIGIITGCGIGIAGGDLEDPILEGVIGGNIEIWGSL